MWTKAFNAVVCWLALSQASGEAVKTVNSSLVKDNVSAESVARLYRNVPIGVYASAAPYAAYSFQIPAFVTAPKPAASRVVPVINNANGYLRDSYGNRFVESPQLAAYKTAFPQQFVPLQALPAHLTHPLVAAPSQAKQSAPHYFVGSQYSGPPFQVATHSPAHGFTGFSQPLIYSQNFRNLAPPTLSPHTQAITSQQQPSSNKAVYANTHTLPLQSNLKNEVKFQRLEQQPLQKEVYSNSAEQKNSGVQGHEDKAPIQAAPATITAIVNGKKTVVNIDTKPPVPLLDLSLLEPLTFANPLVPQVQHFLPRLNEATYHKLPDFNVNEAKTNKKEFNVQKTKSYVSGSVKGKSPKKKTAVVSDSEDELRPAQPTITIKGTPNKSPEFSYEINSPNYKETYNEKSVSYNKANDDEPITYTYDEKTQSQPITYSYSKSEQKKPVSYSIVQDSDGPAQIKHVTYQSNGEQPVTLIYKFKPEEQGKTQSDHQVQSEESGSAEDSSEESDDDRTSHPINHHNPQNAPHPSLYSNNPNHLPVQNHQSVNHPQLQRHNINEHNHDGPRNYNYKPKAEYHHNQHPQSHLNPQNLHTSGHPHQQSHNSNAGNQNVYRHNYRPKDDHRHIYPDHQNHRLNENGHYYSDKQAKSYLPPEHRSQNVKNQVQTQAIHPVPHQYEEHIRILPSEAPATNLKEESSKEDDDYDFRPNPLSSLEQYQKFIENQMRQQKAATLPQLHSSAAPVIHEQAKRIIIQDESPDEMHTHQEQNIRAEMINEDGTNEEDFEKAYKNAAFGFKTFDNDQEKDIYSPESYGFPREHSDFEVEKTPFSEYQAEGDQFPKSTRANYKDAIDGNKENYYLDYSVHKPESMADLYQNKANYLKLYKKYKPEKYFANEYDKRKERKNEKYVISPSFDFSTEPEKKQNYFAQYKTEPIKYEYKFAKETPRDNSAHASHQRFKSKTHFVEPQFQYGFEPIALPRLLDSELAAMATNDSPETDKPGLRKKIYKENWYIKKTSTTGGKHS